MTNESHPRYSEVRDLGIRTVSRSELFLIIIKMDFTRIIRDKVTKNFIKSAPADQIRLIENLDAEIQQRPLKLGIIGGKIQNQDQSK